MKGMKQQKLFFRLSGGVTAWLRENTMPTSSLTHPKMFEYLVPPSNIEDYNFQHMVALNGLFLMSNPGNQQSQIMSNTRNSSNAYQKITDRLIINFLSMKSRTSDVNRRFGAPLPFQKEVFSKSNLNLFIPQM